MRFRPARRFWQVVDRRVVSQQEESVERAVLARRFRAVKISFGHPSILQLIDAPARLRSQLVDRAELNGIGRARLRAGRLETALLPVVTERAFASMSV